MYTMPRVNAFKNKTHLTAPVAVSLGFIVFTKRPQNGSGDSWVFKCICLHTILHNLFLACVLTIGLFSCDLPREEKRPNIIYILADDLGYGDIAAFNEKSKIKTPHLDQFASEGMKFTDAHTSSSVCTPTRYGILTGRYNWRSTLKSGVLWGRSKALIEKERTTAASILKSSGYHTAFIGKWHLGWNWDMDSLETIDFSKRVEHTPNDNGFDYAYGHIASLDIPPYVYVENGMSTAIPLDSTINKGKYSWWRKGLTAPDFVHEDVTPNFFRRGIKYIQQRAATGEPFFLYLPLPSPHTPILPTEEWQGQSGLNPYADFMMMIDDYVGQLNNAVKKAGIEENTLIIFTSDNGCSPAAKIEELKEKGHYPSHIYRGHKADIFEGGPQGAFYCQMAGKDSGGHCYRSNGMYYGFCGHLCGNYKIPTSRYGSRRQL